VRLDALFRLAFATAPSFADLTSPHTRNSSAHSSKGTPSGYRAQVPATPFDCLWARGFRYYFTPLPGCFSPFPHGTSSLSVAKSIQPWTVVRPASHMRDLPRGTQVVCARRLIAFAYGAVTLYGPPFLNGSTSNQLCNSAEALQRLATNSYNPSSETAAAYLAELVWASPFSLATTQGIVSFPPATEMFQFADLPLPSLYIQLGVTGHYPSRVSPFGHPRITACSQLPEAFRCLPRPSSALGAKASTPCPV
jgi:hypothetical protein